MKFFLLTVQVGECCNEQPIEKKRKPKKRSNTNPIPIFFSVQASFSEKGFSESRLSGGVRGSLFQGKKKLLLNLRT